MQAPVKTRAHLDVSNGFKIVPYHIRDEPENKWAKASPYDADYAERDTITIPRQYIQIVLGDRDRVIADWPHDYRYLGKDLLYARKLVLGSAELQDLMLRPELIVTPYRPEEFKSIQDGLYLPKGIELYFVRDGLDIVDVNNHTGHVPDRFYIELIRSRKRS